MGGNSQVSTFLTWLGGIATPAALLVSSAALFVATKQHQHDVSRDNGFGMTIGLTEGRLFLNGKPEFSTQEVTIRARVHGPNPRHSVGLLFLCDGVTNLEKEAAVADVLSESDGEVKRTATVPVRSMKHGYAAVTYIAPSGQGIRTECARIPLAGGSVPEIWHWYPFQGLRMWWAYNRPVVRRNTESLRCRYPHLGSGLESKVAVAAIVPNHATTARLGEWRRVPDYKSVDGASEITRIPSSPARKPGLLRTVLGLD